MRALLFAAALLCGLASAARWGPETTMLSSADFPSGMKPLPSTFLDGRLRDKGKDDKDCKHCHAYISIRYTVPPSECKDFAEHWRKMHKAAHEGHGKKLHMMNIKKTMLDNMFWLDYSEWEDVHELADHFHTDHWKKFSEYLDDAGIKWDLSLLEDESKGLEEERSDNNEVGDDDDDVDKKRRDDDDDHDDDRDDDEAHVLIWYKVPTKLHDEFAKEWKDQLGKKTVKEKGNRVYALRSIATDNEHFYAYGTWKSDKAYMDHFESKHMQKFKEWMNKKEIIWFLVPLETMHAHFHE